MAAVLVQSFSGASQQLDSSVVLPEKGCYSWVEVGQNQIKPIFLTHHYSMSRHLSASCPLDGFVQNGVPPKLVVSPINNGYHWIYGWIYGQTNYY